MSNDSPVESSGDQQPLQQDLRLSPELLASLASSSVCVHRPRRRVSERRDMQAGTLAPMMMLMRSARRQAAHYAQLLRTNLALREEVWNAAEAEPDLLSPPLPHSSKTSSCKKKHSLLYLRPHFFPPALHTILSPPTHSPYTWSCQSRPAPVRPTAPFSKDPPSPTKSTRACDPSYLPTHQVERKSALPSSAHSILRKQTTHLPALRVTLPTPPK